MATKTLPKELGSEKSIRKDLKQAASDAKYLDSRWDELVKQHPDKWVGVLNKELIFAESLTELFQKASESGWDLGTMVVDRLIEKRPAALL